jgi:serine/threonine-protein kinase
MDYVEGTDAARLLREKYPSGMPRAEVAQIISAVADALDYAHARGLLHRDVKPANILLSEGGPRRRILLADFGIARQLGEISGLTATNMLVGTTAYCAPEQLKGAALDGRADQYALGCTAFHLLTGVAPFHDSNAAVVIGQHLSAPPPPIGRPGLADLDPVIARVLAKNPDDRYPTCADFASALVGPAAAAFAAAPTQSAVPVSTPPVPTAPARRNRRGPAPMLAALASATVLAAVALLGMHLVGGRAAPAPSHPSAAPAEAPSPPPSSTVPPPSSTAAAPDSPGLALSNQVTDQSGALGPVERATVDRAVTTLSTRRGTKLWVVYVHNFGGLKSTRWAEETMRANGFGNTDAMLAVATDQPGFSFRVPAAIVHGKTFDIEAVRRDEIAPAVYHRQWARAAVAAANALD